MPPGLFTKRRVVWMSCIFATILGAAILWPAPTPVSEPLPSPNGYDDFVRAGRLLVAFSPDYKKLPTDQLKAAVKSNEEPLRILRVGLGRDCRKPLEYTLSHFMATAKDLPTMKQLAQLVSAEGVLAEREERFGNAAISHTDNIKLGAAFSKGGLVIDHLVGIACEAMGIAGMERVIEKLSAQEARSILGKILEVDRSADNPDEFIARDLVFAKRTSTIRERLQAMWTYKTLAPEQVGLANYKTKAHLNSRRRGDLNIRLASHIYQKEKGTSPRQISDLVPNILPMIPVDPETGTNLVLNPSK
jgi:hypothetical protein